MLIGESGFEIVSLFNTQRYDASDRDTINGAFLIVLVDLFGTWATQVIVRAGNQNHLWL